MTALENELIAEIELLQTKNEELQNLIAQTQSQLATMIQREKGYQSNESRYLTTIERQYKEIQSMRNLYSDNQRLQQLLQTLQTQNKNALAELEKSCEADFQSITQNLQSKLTHISTSLESELASLKSN